MQMTEIQLQRWLSLGLLVFVLVLAIFVAIMPLVTTGLNHHEEKQNLIFRLQRANQIIARKDSIEKQSKQVEQEYQGQNYFSTQNTVALTSADLQKIIKTTISQAGGQLTSTQVLPSRENDDFKRVRVKVRMSGDIEALRTVLYEIESSTPVRIIDQIDIRPVRGKRNRKTRKIEPSSKLNINFQVVGFMRTKADE